MWSKNKAASKRTPRPSDPSEQTTFAPPCHLHELGSHFRDPQTLTWSLDFFPHKCVNCTGRSENRALPAPVPNTHAICLQLSAVKSLCSLCFHRVGCGSPGTPMSVPGSGSHSSAHAFLTHLLPSLILWVPGTTGPGGCMCPPWSSPLLPDHSLSLLSQKSVLTFML